MGKKKPTTVPEPAPAVKRDETELSDAERKKRKILAMQGGHKSTIMNKGVGL